MAVVLKPQKGPQERFLATPADIAIYGGAAGGGKAQPKDEPVLTPTGFVKIGKLKLGDEVVAPDGRIVTVVQIHEQGIVPVYRIKLYDGRETRCTDNHLWQCTIKGQTAVRETSELRARINEGIMIPVCPSPGNVIMASRVTAIEPCGLKRCRCITLSSADGLYITKDYIVTHNSYGLLLTPLRYIRTQGFGATIFRKNYNQIFAQGGLWEESVAMYSAIPNTYSSQSRGVWVFNNANGEPVSKLNFAHIERFEDTKNWQGAQLCFIGYDELTHFSRQTFFYMLSRNRSTCGVKPFIRATCNPDATSWVADFISWWIDQDTGYPIPERSGKLRWFIRENDVIYWADTKEELWKQFELISEEERAEPKSVTFIASSIYDNKELLRVNPQYLANLKALPTVEREQLLNGNWKIKPAAGLYFKTSQVGDFLTVIPNDVIQWVRCWDLAATENDGKGEPAYTAGVLLGKRKNGRYIIADVINKQMSASDVRNTIRLTAQRDREKYKRVRIRIPQDPGQAGKDQAQSYVRLLSGFDIVTVPETGSKESRAEPLAAQWQGGNVDVLQADWTDEYLQQMENFPEWKFKDMVDASANGFTELEHKTQFNLSSLV